MTHDFKRYLLLAGAAALIAGCHKHDTTASSDASTPPPSDIMASSSVAPPASDAGATSATAATPDFVQKAAASDMFEIESSKLALKKSANADVKDFARMMIKDHTQSTAMLKMAIKESGQNLAPPAALPDDKQAALNTLANTDPKGFDKAYLDAQVDGHTQALALMTNYAANGDTAPIKAFAGKVAPIVQHHLDKAKALQASMQ